MRIAEIPPGAEIVTTYADCERQLRAYAEGHFPFLWLVGKPGTGKSESMKRAIKGTTAVILKASQLTPIAFYAECYEYRNLPLILDDAEHLADKEIGAKLISSLSEHTKVKTLEYKTAGAWLDKQKIPHSFRTTSRLAVIANKWTPHAALQSRAVLVYFNPTPAELHAEVGRWFRDQEIYDFLGSVLHLIAPDKLDVRIYNKARMKKAARLDWQKWLMDTYCHDAAVSIVQKLEADANFKTVAARVKRFAELTGQSRATYYRIKDALSAKGQLHDPEKPLDLPKVDLSNNPEPEEEPEPEEDEDEEEEPDDEEDGL